MLKEHAGFLGNNSSPNHHAYFNSKESKGKDLPPLPIEANICAVQDSSAVLAQLRDAVYRIDQEIQDSSAPGSCYARNCLQGREAEEDVERVTSQVSVGANHRYIIKPVGVDTYMSFSSICQ